MTLVIVPKNEKNNQIVFVDFGKEKLEAIFNKKDFVLKDEQVTYENIIKNLNEVPLKREFIKKFSNNPAIQKYVNYNFQYFFELMRNFQIATLQKKQVGTLDVKIGEHIHQLEIGDILDEKTGEYTINLKDNGAYQDGRELLPIDDEIGM